MIYLSKGGAAVPIWTIRGSAPDDGWGGTRVRSLQPSVRILLDSPSRILQESMDSRYITWYAKLKHLRESI